LRSIRTIISPYASEEPIIWPVLLEKQEEPIIWPDNVLAVDLGCKNIAVTVNTVNTKPNFYGAAIRGIRGFYFNLRRK